MENDLINRQAAINAIENTDCELPPYAWDELTDAIMSVPSAQPEIIRCRDCKWWGYDDETGDVRVCHAAKHGHISSHWDISIRRVYRGDFYCADAERRTDGTEQP